MTKVFVAIATLVALIVVAAALLPYLVDLNDYREQITQRLEALTGQELEIAGGLRLKVLPTPRLSVEKLRFGDPAAVDPADLTTVQSLDLRLAFRPLLVGDIRIRSLVLVQPSVTVIIGPDGRAVWPRAAGGTESAAAGPEQPGLAMVGLDRLAVENGSIIYRNAAMGLEERVDGINAEVLADALSGPFRGSGTGRWRGLDVSAEVATGSFEGALASLTGSLQAAQGDSRLTFRGSLDRRAAKPRWTGKVELEGADLATLVAGISDALGGGALGPASLRRPFEASGDLKAVGATLAFDNLQLRLGDAAASGDLELALGRNTNLNVRLAVNRLDLGDWLDAPAEGSDAGARARFTLPSGLTGAVEVSAAAITWRGSNIRGLRLAAQMADGAVVLSRASASLTGGSRLTLSGRATTPGGAPRFDGRLTAGSDNLRALLSTLRIDPGDIPRDRLRRFMLETEVGVTGDIVQFRDIDLQLDSSRVTGALAYALRLRPSFGIDLQIDRLNVDAYLKPARGETPAAADVGLISRLSPATFGRFDTNARLRVGGLTYRTVRARDLDLDLTLFNGDLTVRRLKVADAAGVAGGMSGSVRGIHQEPAFDLSIQLAGARLSSLGRFTDAPLPDALSGVGAFEFNGDATGSLTKLTVDITGALADADLRLRGGLADLASEPRFDLAFSAPGESWDRTMQGLGTGWTASAEADGPLAVNAALTGGLESMEVDLAGNLAASEVKISGTAGFGDEGFVYDVGLVARNSDLAALTANLGIGGDLPIGGGRGVVVTTAAIGNLSAVAFDDLELTVGPARAAGRVAARFDGDRPSLDVRLSADHVAVDPLLSVSGNAEGDAVWSLAPIDLGWMRGLDAKVALAADRLTADGYVIEGADLEAELDAGVLEISRLAGSLFGGALEVDGTVRSAPLPSFDIEANLENGRLRPALAAIADNERLAGSFDFDGRFAATGRNQREMISTLTGSARLAVQDGSISGVDIPALSERLTRPIDSSEFLRQAAARFREGKTRLTDAEGTWTVRNGLARSDDTVANLEAATVAVIGAVDLPRWQLDLKTRLRLTEHSAAPSFGMAFRGPIGAPTRREDTQKLREYFVGLGGSPSAD